MVVDDKMRSNVHRVTPKKEEKPEAVDREKTCPLLLRVFTTKDTLNTEMAHIAFMKRIICSAGSILFFLKF